MAVAVTAVVGLGGVRSASAAPGTLIAAGLTSPPGFVWTGAHLWVSGHVQGFCRLDTSANGLAGIIAAACVLVAVAPGQPVFDAVSNSVYVTDLSSKSVGVVRYTFDPVTESIVNAAAIAPSLGGDRPAGAALDGAGNLYVGDATSLYRYDPAAGTLVLLANGLSNVAAVGIGAASLLVGDDPSGRNTDLPGTPLDSTDTVALGYKKFTGDRICLLTKEP